MAEPLQALILAGSRGGADPLAAYAGVAHKALIELDGRTLLARVAEALSAVGVTTIAVSTNEPAVADASGALGLGVLEAASGPSESVGRALATLGTPLLVTTADHALLRAEWITQFLGDVPADVDVAVLLARRETIEAAAPGTRRTYLRFPDGDWSGCNLFYLATPRAAQAIALWRSVERNRKRPWRIVRRFGLVTLLDYLFGRLTLTGALSRLGALAGVNAAAVESRYGLAAVDVDKPDDLDLARKIVVSG